MLQLNYFKEGYYKTVNLPTLDAVYWMCRMHELGISCYVRCCDV